MSKQKQNTKSKVSKKTKAAKPAKKKVAKAITKKVTKKVAKKKVAKSTTKAKATKPKAKATKPKAKEVSKAEAKEQFVDDVLGSIKKGEKFELTESKGKDYGLSLRQGIYRVLFYKDGKMVARSTRQTDISKARKVRDAVYARLTKKHDATWKGNRASKMIADAKADPDGMAGIYPQTIYRVNVGGKTITTTTNLGVAKARRNKAIKTLGL